MPIDRHIISTLDAEHVLRITTRALSHIERKGGPEALANAEATESVELLVDEANASYENVMNKLIFDMNMLNASNMKMFQELALPPMEPSPPAPVFACVAMPSVPAHLHESDVVHARTNHHPWLHNTKTQRRIGRTLRKCLVSSSRELF